MSDSLIISLADAMKERKSRTKRTPTIIREEIAQVHEAIRLAEDHNYPEEREELMYQLENLGNELSRVCKSK